LTRQITSCHDTRRRRWGNVDLWAWATIGAAVVLGMFVTTMAFRGLMEIFDEASGRCGTCGRLAALPLPPASHLCLHCRVHQIFGRRRSLRH
jgi:hypothetical protein